jgi:hypothetical protein
MRHWPPRSASFALLWTVYETISSRAVATTVDQCIDLWAVVEGSPFSQLFEPMACQSTSRVLGISSGLKESLPECRVSIAGDGHQFGKSRFVAEISE